MDNEKRNPSEFVQEEQFILRVPPEVAKNIRKMMKTHNVNGIEFYFTDERKGKFRIGDQEYNLTLCDLPCVVETHKTLDNRSYYKSGDIGQMLLVEDPNAPPPKKPLYDEHFRLLDAGVTPPTRNIRKRKFRKRPDISREEIQEAEAEILRILKNDAFIQTEEIELVKDEEALQRYLDSIKATHTQKKMSQTETKETNKIPKSSFENEDKNVKKDNERENMREVETLTPLSTTDTPIQFSPQPMTEISLSNIVNTPQLQEQSLPESLSFSTQASPLPMLTPVPSTPPVPVSPLQLSQQQQQQPPPPPQQQPQLSPPLTPQPKDWTKDPRYIELVQQRDILQNEIKSLRTQNEVDRNRLNQEQNPIMKTRLEEKINRMNSKIQTKEEQLQEINLKIQRLQQTSI